MLPYLRVERQHKRPLYDPHVELLRLPLPDHDALRVEDEELGHAAEGEEAGGEEEGADADGVLGVEHDLVGGDQDRQEVGGEAQLALFLEWDMNTFAYE